MYLITIYFQKQNGSESYIDAKWAAKNWRQAAAIALRKTTPFVRANVNRIVVCNPKDNGERRYRKENPYDFKPVLIVNGKRVNRRATDKMITEQHIIGHAKTAIMAQFLENQNKFYKEFQNFVTTAPDSEFTNLHDTVVKTTELVDKFWAQKISKGN